MSKKGLTGQSVEGQVEMRHGSAEPELRRDVSCAEKRSDLVRGTRVYQPINLSKNVRRAILI